MITVVDFMIVVVVICPTKKDWKQNENVIPLLFTITLSSNLLKV